jgi:hypothetical protein
LSTGNALKMRLQLKQLGVRHRVASESVSIPLFDPTDHPVEMCGYASTDDIDNDRTKFRPYCFAFPKLFRHGYPPLYLKHDRSREVGTIDHLQRDELGNLQCWVTVADPEAKRYPAFSIAATVNEYEIRNEDTPDFHALVTSATLEELSLTNVPANKFCIVQDRYRVSAAVQMFELLAEKVKRLQKLTTIIKEQHHG